MSTANKLLRRIEEMAVQINKGTSQLIEVNGQCVANEKNVAAYHAAMLGIAEAIKDEPEASQGLTTDAACVAVLRRLREALAIAQTLRCEA